MQSVLIAFFVCEGNTTVVYTIWKNAEEFTKYNYNYHPFSKV